MNTFISDVWANANATSQGGPYSLIVMLVIFAIFFYFIIFRPQQKRSRAHRELLNSISKGDEILTNGGLVGRVIKVTDTGYILVTLNEKNNDTYNYEVLLKRDCVTTILPKGTMRSL